MAENAADPEDVAVLVADSGPKGLPGIDAAERSAAQRRSYFTLPALFVFQLALGFALALAVYRGGSTAQYDSKIARVKEERLHWAYLSALVFARLVAFLNYFPVFYKARLMRPGSGNLRVCLATRRWLRKGGTQRRVQRHAHF